MGPLPQSFDFEQWRALAENDLPGYFDARKQAIEAFINSVPPSHQANLRDLQRMIDATRAEAGTPTRSVRRMMGMMSDHLDAMKVQLQRLSEESAALAETLGKSRDA